MNRETRLSPAAEREGDGSAARAVVPRVSIQRPFWLLRELHFLFEILFIFTLTLRFSFDRFGGLYAVLFVLGNFILGNSWLYF